MVMDHDPTTEADPVATGNSETAQEIAATATDALVEVAPPAHEQEETESPRAEIMDEKAEAFHNRMSQLVAEDRDIFVFRGAGTKNGIAPEDADKAVAIIVEMMQRGLDAGHKLAIMFDGDEDNRKKPDVGAIFGMVADALKDNPDVAMIAAQQQSWYDWGNTGKTDPIASAAGTPFETFVFPDNMPGSHAALTQSRELANYANYRQIFTGPAGAISSDQLRDLDKKVEGGNRVEVLAIATHNNPALTEEFQQKLAAAEESGDTEKADGFRKTLTQREKEPFGIMYTQEGDIAIDRKEYPHLNITMQESLVPEIQKTRAERKDREVRKIANSYREIWNRIHAEGYELKPSDLDDLKSFASWGCFSDTGDLERAWDDDEARRWAEDWRAKLDEEDAHPYDQEN